MKKSKIIFLIISIVFLAILIFTVRDFQKRTVSPWKNKNGAEKAKD